MRRSKWILVLAVVLASALLAAGCGDDDDSDGGDTDVTVATTETGSSDATDTGAGSSLIEQCVATTEAGHPGLSDEAHRKIEEACRTSASGDPADALDAAAEACRVIAEETVPKGPPRDQALAACGVAPGGGSP